MPISVAIESNSLTDLTEALLPGFDPAASDSPPGLSAERVAILRTMLYADVRLWVPPTVEAEYDAIRETSRHLRHQQLAFVALDDTPLRADPAKISERANHLGAFHRGGNDCRIIAEVEAFGAVILVTRDGDLIKHLSRHTRITLQPASVLWASLGIARGAKPRRCPNTLIDATWWRV